MPDSATLTTTGNQPWSNWMETMSFVPSVQYSPSSFAELKQVLQQAATAKKPVRVVGSSKSWSPGPVPGNVPYTEGMSVDGYLLDLSGLAPTNARSNAELKVKYFSDAGGNTFVAIPPGTLQGWFAENMANNGAGNDPKQHFSNAHAPQALGTMGASPIINVCGFVGNGCHGTGWNQPPAADQLMGVELMTVDATGTVVNVAFAATQALADAMVVQGVSSVTPTVSAEAMNAARCSLGSLGVIVKAVVQTEPLYNVKERDDIAPLGEVFPKNGDPSNLEELVTSAGYTEIFWYPYNDSLWIKRFSRTDLPTQFVGSQLVFNAITAAMQSLTHNEMGKFFAAFPKATPLTLQLLWKTTQLLLKNKPMQDLDFEKDWDQTTDPVLPVNQAFVFLNTKFFNNIADLEHTIPIPPKPGGGHDFSPVIIAWKAVIAKIAEMRAQSPAQFPINIIVHFRFIKDSPTTLSPSLWPIPDTHTCYIEYMTFTEQTQQFYEFSDSVIPVWEKLGGLPNWGKWFNAVATATQDAHNKLKVRSGLPSFMSTKAAMDPTGTFNNSLLNQLLLGMPGPAVQPAAAPAPLSFAAEEEGDTFIYKLAPGETPQSYPEHMRIWSKAGWSLYQDLDVGLAVLIGPKDKMHPMSVSFNSAKGELIYSHIEDDMRKNKSSSLFKHLNQVLKQSRSSAS